MDEDKRIIEINGMKLEVDMRNARRIDTFRVGDNVKLLKKGYNEEINIYPGIVTDFANFKDLPTIIVAYMDNSYSDVTIKFENINSNSTSQIVYATSDEVKLSREGVIEKYDDKIAKTKSELLDLVHRKDFFIRHFMKNADDVMKDNGEKEEQECSF